MEPNATNENRRTLRIPLETWREMQTAAHATAALTEQRPSVARYLIGLHLAEMRRIEQRAERAKGEQDAG